MARVTTSSPILEFADVQGPRVLLTVSRYSGSRRELVGTASLHVSELQKWLDEHARRTAAEEEGLFREPRF